MREKYSSRKQRILWIQEGKKKQVVYDFIDHVGLKWMDGVEAVVCDMNSDFQEAFEEKCPHIQPVFDHFHIIKNFNDKVISRSICAESNYFDIRLVFSKEGIQYPYTDAFGNITRLTAEDFSGKKEGQSSSIRNQEKIVRDYCARNDIMLLQQRMTSFARKQQ